MYLSRKIVKNNSIVQNRRPVTFITIPIDSERSILDYDLVGENCSMKSDSKYPLFFSSPGKFDFVKNMGNKELTVYAKSKNIKLNFIKVDSLEKAKNAPCIMNNWANFYKGKFISNTILNANSFEKLLK